jgi:hypothetical protein
MAFKSLPNSSQETDERKRTLVFSGQTLLKVVYMYRKL